MPRPERTALDGCYARLEPLASAQQPGGDDRFRYLFGEPPLDAAAFQPWLDQAAASADPLFFAMIDRATERAEGRQSLMRLTRPMAFISPAQLPEQTGKQTPW